MEQKRVNVYVDGEVIARVRYNSNLDRWDGNNWSCGTLGRHRGLTKLKDGSYVLIHGSDFQGSNDWGEIISKEKALQEIVKSENLLLLTKQKWKELKKLYAEQLDNQEDERAD